MYVLCYDRRLHQMKGGMNIFIYVGNSETCLENELAAGPLFTSGFIEFEKTAQGQYVCIRRVEVSQNRAFNFKLFEVRLY